MKILSLIIALSLLLVGCSSESAPKNSAFASEDVDGTITDSNLEFAFDVLGELNKGDLEENVFISTFSISTALAMTYNGAEGETLEEMEEVLNFSGIPRNIVNVSYKSLLDYLVRDDKEVKTLVSNSIWYRQGEEIKEEYLNTIEDYYKAYIKDLDFDKPEAVDTINDWIDDSTKGMIPGMLQPPIPRDVLMYLINAVYF